MIGGDDVVIALRPGWGPDVMREFLVLMREMWPQAIVEEINEPIAFPIGDIGEDFREGFIYRDHDALIEWATRGAPEGGEETMVSVILKRRSMTFVVGDRNSPIGRKVYQFAQVWSGPIHP